VTYQVMADAMHADVMSIPANAPLVAGYVTGSSEVQWTAADWARFSEGKVRIDQSPELAAFAAGKADVADVETGAGTIAQAAAGAAARKGKGWLSWIYASQGNLAAMKAAVQAAGLAGHVQYWVADWSLSEAEAAAALGGDVVAVQWASPSSNPATVAPGTVQTLAELNTDLSVTVPGWFMPHQVQAGVVVTSALIPVPVTSSDGKTWTARP
jgi:hypothetical protein